MEVGARGGFKKTMMRRRGGGDKRERGLKEKKRGGGDVGGNSQIEAVAYRPYWGRKRKRKDSFMGTEWIRTTHLAHIRPTDNHIIYIYIKKF